MTPTRRSGPSSSSFRPEFLNRFQHVVLFHPLTQSRRYGLPGIDLRSILKREGIAGRNLIVDVHDDVIEHVLAVGFNRAMAVAASSAR